MNMVEIFFGIITRQTIRRGTYTSVADLIGAIRAFIDSYNQRCEPFRWTKTADQIPTKPTVKRTQTRDTRPLSIRTADPPSTRKGRPVACAPARPTSYKKKPQPISQMTVPEG
jgi:hypothetical protein